MNVPESDGWYWYCEPDGVWEPVELRIMESGLYILRIGIATPQIVIDGLWGHELTPPPCPSMNIVHALRLFDGR